MNIQGDIEGIQTWGTGQEMMEAYKMDPRQLLPVPYRVINIDGSTLLENMHTEWVLSLVTAQIGIPILVRKSNERDGGFRRTVRA